ncbi:hypothetical protein Tco_1288009 [Tanacetum coccineum]
MCIVPCPCDIDPPLHLGFVIFSPLPTYNHEVVLQKSVATTTTQFLDRLVECFIHLHHVIKDTPTFSSTSRAVSISLVLRIDKILPLVENADSDATEEAWTLNISRAMRDRTGN